jgi:hypothetical protein
MLTAQDWESILLSLNSLGLRVQSHDRATGRIVLQLYPLPRHNTPNTG